MLNLRNDASKRRGTRPLLRLIGGSAPPLAWALHLGLGYALAGWTCVHDAGWLLYALTVAALLLAAAGIAAARVPVRRTETAGMAPARFLERGERLLGLLFFAVILVQSIPIVLLEACP